MMEDFLNPIEVLKDLKLQPDMAAADLGCGSGGWTIPLAKELEDGFVYALDILEEPLSALQSRAKLEKLQNIRTIRADLEKQIPLGSDSIDFVLISNLLFQCENKKGIFSEAKRILKKGGRILVVDWKTNASLGPEKESRVSEEEIKKIAQEFGLKPEKEFEAGTCHFGLIFEK